MGLSIASPGESSRHVCDRVEDDLSIGDVAQIDADGGARRRWMTEHPRVHLVKLGVCQGR